MCLDRFATRVFNYCLDKTIGAFSRKFVPGRYHLPGIKHPEIMQWEEYAGKAFASRWIDIFFAVHALPIVFFLLYVIDTRFGGNNTGTCWMNYTLTIFTNKKLHISLIFSNLE